MTSITSPTTTHPSLDATDPIGSVGGGGGQRFLPLAKPATRGVASIRVGGDADVDDDGIELPPTHRIPRRKPNNSNNPDDPSDSNDPNKPPSRIPSYVPPASRIPPRKPPPQHPGLHVAGSRQLA